MIKGILSLRNGRAWLITEAGTEDLPIFGSDVGAAMDGDQVLCDGIRRRGRPAAVVERILKRRSPLVAGSLDLRGRDFILVSEQATDPFRLDFARGGFEKSALRQGLRVVGEIETWPTPYLPGVAVLRRILGEPGTATVEIEVARVARRVPGGFPPEVTAAAAAIPLAVSREEKANRLDLTALPIVTVDPEDARDFDDAISLEPLSAGRYRLGIHVADVSHYVRPGSPIDREAYWRATSTYLPGEVVPMLPERLSNGICSLVQGEERLAVTILVELDRHLAPVSFSHHRSVIRSQRRFTYDEVDAILDGRSTEFASEFAVFKRIAERLAAGRLGRGAFDLDLPEIKPVLAPGGKVIAVRKVARTWSHRIIEELMILANEYAARSEKGRGLYRVHDAPDPEKILRLRSLAAALGAPVRRGGVMEIIERFRESPAFPVIQFLALRSMQEARYDAENTGHFGLASEAYTHFTSPIRRYPDLVVHRLLFENDEPASAVEVARHASRREREAMEAEREATKIRLLEYAETRLGEEAEGVIENVTKNGLVVVLELGPRGFIRIEELGNESFTFNRDGLTMIGRRTGVRYKLGDPIRVVIAAVSLAEREMYLVPVSARRIASGGAVAGSPAPRRAGGGSARPLKVEARPARGRRKTKGPRQPTGRGRGRRRRR
jgi:ribonuclease R